MITRPVDSLRILPPMMQTQRLFATLCLMSLLVPSPDLLAHDDWDGLAGEMFSRGIEMDGTLVPVQPPACDPRAEEEERATAAKKLAGSRGWAQFTRKSTVAPVHMDLEYIKDSDGKRIGVRARFAFIAHGELDTLRNNDVMSRLFATESDESAGEGTRSESISPEVFATYGVQPEPGVSYSQLEMILLKKVALAGVIATQRIDTDDFFALAWVLDERFSNDTSDANRPQNTWSRIERNERGQAVRTAPKPYAGAAGYLVVSRVPGANEASLLEGEVLLHEPDEWFSGSNLLRSKLPLIVQEGARKLRRGLK